ncbi:MAG: TetR/AcrR family transcriptional regulator [Ilumatobacteraceae bacterium]|nr:TetR/AcrR family transcriptional regulator [Ilumatobacteraceae bacterium]MBU6242312.1 TetR/AcrR family transcriptional regulator [Acidobacteriota bacterium]
MEVPVGVPQPVQARAEATVSVVIEATIKAIEASGEASVRIDDILNETGISKGSLYHHFGGREGLIAAARVVQFSRFVAEDAKNIRETLTKTTSLQEFIAATSALVELNESVERVSARHNRLSVIASSYGRPELRQSLALQQHSHTEHIADAVRYGQKMGWIRTDVDARAVAVFVQGYNLARVLLELDTEPVKTTDWDHVVRVALGSFFVTQP